VYLSVTDSVGVEAYSDIGLSRAQLTIMSTKVRSYPTGYLYNQASQRLAISRRVIAT